MNGYSLYDEMEDLQTLSKTKYFEKHRLSRHYSEQFCPSESFIHHVNHHTGMNQIIHINNYKRMNQIIHIKPL